MAQFVNHEPCKKCGSRDNFGRYDDGGGFCFGCHHHEPATHAPMRHMGTLGEDHEKYHKPMPHDVGHHFSAECVEWLGRFHVDVPTAIRNGLVWSPSQQQLIYQLGNVWQARNFRRLPDGESRKYRKNFTSGDVNECLHIYSAGMGLSGQSRLVIVEDPLSALRIGPWCDAMPLLGSHLATARLKAVAGLYSSLTFWLDSDKLKEAQSMAQQAKYMGLDTRVIWTPEDPKCYTDTQIQEILA